MNEDWTVTSDHTMFYYYANATISLYENVEHAGYINWLGSTAYQFVKSVSPYTEDELTSFQLTSERYSSWSLQITHGHRWIWRQGQAASLCILRNIRVGEDTQAPGFLCTTAYAKFNDAVDTFYMHYIPAEFAAQYNRLLQRKELDLTDYEHEHYIVESDTEGFDVFQFQRLGKSGYRANKFMLNEASQYSYQNNKDLRYDVGDEVTLYSIFKYENGTILSSHESTRLTAAHTAATVAMLGLLTVSF